MTVIRRLLPASGIRKIFDRAQELRASGREILNLDVGRPDYPMPNSGVVAAKNALDQGFVHYIQNRGLPELLTALSHHIATTTKRTFNPANQIVTTLGATEALMAFVMTMVSSGDEVIIPTPAWPHYETVTALAEGIPVVIPTDPRQGFVLDPERVAKAVTKRTKVIIMMNPGNPTGAVQPSEVLKAIAEIALKHGIYVFSDEAYQHFIYAGEHCSIGQFMGDSPLFVHCGTFSKSYAMTGWRLGYLASSTEISDAVNRFHQHATVCGVSFAQSGAVAVLKDPNRAQYLSGLLEEFRKRRQIWMDTLGDLTKSLQLTAPDGAFYLFPKVPGASGDEFSKKLLETAGLSTVPGACFGIDFKQYTRISYGASAEIQQKAARIFVEAINAER